MGRLRVAQWIRGFVPSMGLRIGLPSRDRLIQPDSVRRCLSPGHLCLLALAFMPGIAGQSRPCPPAQAVRRPAPPENRSVYDSAGAPRSLRRALSAALQPLFKSAHLRIAALFICRVFTPIHAPFFAGRGIIFYGRQSLRNLYSFDAAIKPPPALAEVLDDGRNQSNDHQSDDRG